MIASFFRGQPFEVPTEMKAGQPASITFSTAQRELLQEDSTTVEVVGSVARIIPYDLALKPQKGRFYNQYIVAVPRTVKVVFPTSGPAIIRVLGYKAYGVLDSMERQVTVQP